MHVQAAAAAAVTVTRIATVVVIASVIVTVIVSVIVTVSVSENGNATTQQSSIQWHHVLSRQISADAHIRTETGIQKMGAPQPTANSKQIRRRECRPCYLAAATNSLFSSELVVCSFHHFSM